jgi:hypothetical protein
MKDTNQIEKALKQKISKELRDIVDKFTDDVKKISDKYGGKIFYDFKQYSTNEGVEFHVQGISLVNGVLHRMLMDNHGEHMLKYKSKELLNKLELI